MNRALWGIIIWHFQTKLYLWVIQGTVASSALGVESAHFARRGRRERTWTWLSFLNRKFFKKGRKEGRKPSFPIPTAQGDSETWKGIFGPVVSLTLLLHRFKTNVLKIFRDELISRSLPSEEGLSRHTTHSSQPLEHFSSNLPASPRQPHTQTRLPPNIKWQHRSKAKQRFSTHESLVSKRSYLYALSVILEHTAPFKWENIFLG